MEKRDSDLQRGGGGGLSPFGSLSGKYSGPVTHYMIIINHQANPAGNNFRHLGIYRIEKNPRAPHRVVSWSTIRTEKISGDFFVIEGWGH